MHLISDILGYTSIVSWILVFTPQVWENYKRKSGDSLSVAFLTIWLIADIFSIIGILMADLLPTMLYLSIYYAIADIILLYQVVHYRMKVKKNEDEEANHELLLLQSHSERNDQVSGSCLISIISALIFSFTTAALILIPVIGAAQFVGWNGSVLYIGSRIPQVYKNYKDSTTGGLSIGTFIFSVIGNVTYCLSILFYSIETKYILHNLAWLVGSLGTLLLDIIILAQFHIYD